MSGMEMSDLNMIGNVVIGGYDPTVGGHDSTGGVNLADMTTIPVPGDTSECYPWYTGQPWNICSCYHEDKGKKAIALAKMLVDKGFAKADKGKQLMELLDAIMKEL